jgi:hypothetical protein
MAETLVLYFSRSGMTATLAQELAKKLGASLGRVTPTASYAGPGGYLKGVWQALRGEAPPVEPSGDISRYALVVIGSPVWAGRLSPPMRSCLRGVRGRIEGVGAFWVSGSGAPYRAVGAEVERLTGKAPVATAAFSQREVVRGATDAKLEALAKALGAVERPAA